MKDSIVSKCIPGTGNKVVFIMGWGNRLDDACVLWLEIQAKRENWNLLIIEIPTEFLSFQKILSKIQDEISEEKIDLLIGFSMGALFAVHLNAHKRIFVSPYWKIPIHRLINGSYGLSMFFLKLIKFIRIPILPRGFSEDEIGEMDIPKFVPEKISPYTIHEIILAQNGIPEIGSSDYIFICETDNVIDLSVAYGKTNVQEFIGGHCFLSTYDRDRVFQKIIEITKE